jgi:hypothetical protein
MWWCRNNACIPLILYDPMQTKLGTDCKNLVLKNTHNKSESLEFKGQGSRELQELEEHIGFRNMQGCSLKMAGTQSSKLKL